MKGVVNESCLSTSVTFSHLAWGMDLGLAEPFTVLYPFRRILGLEVQGATCLGNETALVNEVESEEQLHARMTGRLPRAVGDVPRGVTQVAACADTG